MHVIQFTILNALQLLHHPRDIDIWLCLQFFWDFIIVSDDSVFCFLSPSQRTATSCGTPQRESVSPTLNIVQEDIGLPQGEVIPDDYKEMTEPWVQVSDRFVHKHFQFHLEK